MLRPIFLGLLALATFAAFHTGTTLPGKLGHSSHGEHSMSACGSVRAYAASNEMTKAQDAMACLL
jgi:hypothetical protein